MIDHSPLFVNEIFGPTIQGEGPALGQPCVFLRLGYCNLTCSWCDTAYTWDFQGKNGQAHDPSVEITPRRPAEVAEQLAGYLLPLVVISGGEPLLQHRALGTLLPILARKGIAVDIETNGTVVPSFDADLARRYVVSPKLAHAGNGLRARSHQAMAWFYRSGRAVYKFVCATPADLLEVAEWVERFKIQPHEVSIMPEGRTAAEVTERLKALIVPASLYGWTVTPRLHIMLWGNERGR